MNALSIAILCMGILMLNHRVFVDSKPLQQDHALEFQKLKELYRKNLINELKHELLRKIFEQQSEEFSNEEIEKGSNPSSETIDIDEIPTDLISKRGRFLYSRSLKENDHKLDLSDSDPSIAKRRFLVSK